MMIPPLFRRLAWFAVALVFGVILLGAYTRLSHAGLGCPDWPGCYGEVTWPKHDQEIAAANELHPDRPVEVHKAWKEMVHRYFAGLLMLTTFVLAALGGAQSQGGRTTLARGRVRGVSSSCSRPRSACGR
jgi:cytochrome c oxidase assembly protein subunit 15